MDRSFRQLRRKTPRSQSEAPGLRQGDLAALIGSQPHASEVLNRRLPLTLAMIRALSGKWNVPADVLVRQYDLTKAPAV